MAHRDHPRIVALLERLPRLDWAVLSYLYAACRWDDCYREEVTTRVGELVAENARKGRKPPAYALAVQAGNLAVLGERSRWNELLDRSKTAEAIQPALRTLHMLTHRPLVIELAERVLQRFPDSEFVAAMGTDLAMFAQDRARMRKHLDTHLPRLTNAIGLIGEDFALRLAEGERELAEPAAWLLRHDDNWMHEQALVGAWHLLEGRRDEARRLATRAFETGTYGCFPLLDSPILMGLLGALDHDEARVVAAEQTEGTYNWRGSALWEGLRGASKVGM